MRRMCVVMQIWIYRKIAPTEAEIQPISYIALQVSALNYWPIATKLPLFWANVCAAQDVNFEGNPSVVAEISREGRLLFKWNARSSIHLRAEYVSRSCCQDDGSLNICIINKGGSNSPLMADKFSIMDVKYFEGIFVPLIFGVEEYLCVCVCVCMCVCVCVYVLLCRFFRTVGTYLTAQTTWCHTLTTLIFIGRLQLPAKNCAQLPKLHGVTSLKTVLTLRHLVLPGRKRAQDLQDQDFRFVRFPFMPCTVDFCFWIWYISVICRVHRCIRKTVNY